MGDYEFDFSENSPYGAALGLLEGTDLTGKSVLDVGCGSAALAEPLQARGARYIGVDLDKDAILRLTDGGFEGHVVDLGSANLQQEVGDIIGDREVAALVCLDVLEHVPEPEAVLAALTAATANQPSMELIVSIPNVAHIDIARKLLLGRWDMTDTGLLDRTHLRFFTEQSLGEALARVGWFESVRRDFHLQRSDQHVAGHPAFELDTTLGRFLHMLRAGADDTTTVNQFVRRYHRGRKRQATQADDSRPFLSVVVRTSGERQETLVEVLLCLAAQTDLDFEIVLVLHNAAREADVTDLVNQFEGNLAQRVRHVTCPSGSRGRAANAGLDETRGSYVTYLDDDDLVTADWVAAIKAGAAAAPGRVVRSWAAEQSRHRTQPHELALHTATGPLRPVYAKPFDLIRHIRQNETPFHCFAFPRLLTDLGFRFDEALSVCEDWQFLLKAAALCGVHDTERMTCIYNRWSNKSSAHAVSSDEWTAMRTYIHVTLDEHPLLLPPGSISQLDEAAARSEEDQRQLERFQSRIADLEQELARTHGALADHQRVALDAHHALDEIRGSTSWRISAPVRAIGTVARKLRSCLRRG